MESDESGKYDVDRLREQCAQQRTVPSPSRRFDAQPAPRSSEPEAALLNVVAIAPRMFRVMGELDLSSVHVAETALAPELPVQGDLTLDLSDLSFMDSTGLHLLIRIAMSLSGDLVLQCPRPHVVRVLELSRVATIANVVVRTTAAPTVRKGGLSCLDAPSERAAGVKRSRLPPSRSSNTQRLAETGPESTT